MLVIRKKNKRTTHYTVSLVRIHIRPLSLTRLRHQYVTGLLAEVHVKEVRESAKKTLSHVVSNLRTSNSPERFRLQLLVCSSKKPSHVPLTGNTVGNSPRISA